MFSVWSKSLSCFINIQSFHKHWLTIVLVYFLLRSYNYDAFFFLEIVYLITIRMFWTTRCICIYIAPIAWRFNLPLIVLINVTSILSPCYIDEWPI